MEHHPKAMKHEDRDGEAMGNRPNNQPLDRRETVLTPERCDIFFEDLARHGIATMAARKASPLSTHVDGAVSTFYTRKRLDPRFAARWKAALETADGLLLAEAHRRAVDGTKKALYFKQHRITELDEETGKQVPVSEKVYSDRLLELLLRARFPRLFIDRLAVTHGNAPSGWVISAADLECLSEAQTEALSGIMNTIMTARGEIVADHAMADAELIDVTPETEPEELEPEPEKIADIIPY